MPYKFEHKHKYIPKELKRSYKLSDSQRADIKKRHKAGEPINSIARSYIKTVCRRTIVFVIYPERAKKVMENSNRKRKERLTAEKKREYAKSHRKYKHSIKDKLVDKKKK